jgi:hypothetical protein
MADSVIKGTISLDEALERVRKEQERAQADELPTCCAKARPAIAYPAASWGEISGCFSAFQEKPRRRLSRKGC